MDPDQLDSLKPADLDLHCFQNVIHQDGFTMVWDENVHASPTPAAFVLFAMILYVPVNNFTVMMSQWVFLG